MKRSFVSKLVSIIIAVTVAFGSMPTMLALAEDLDINESRTIEAVTLLEENTGKTLADIAKENGWLRYDWRLSYDLENNHLQGLTVDDELKYMYLSTGDYIIKLDISTGCVVGSITNFGKNAGMTEDMGAHLGCLDYYDGWVYCGMIAANPSAKLFVLSVDASKIDRIGIDAMELTEGVNAILLKDHIEDYRAQVTEKFTNWSGLGHFTMTEEEGHRFGCGGVDAITFGTYPGDESGKMYIIAGYSTFKSVNNPRQDNTYTVLRFYPLDEVWDSDRHQPKGEQNIRYTQSRIESVEYGENEALAAEKTLFLYTGNIDWGSQNLEFEEDSKDIVAYCYGPTDFWVDNSEPPRVMFVIDGSIAPTEKVLELGQNNTLTNETDKAYVKAIADAYSIDSNNDGQIGDDERLKGAVGTLKCHCGNRESHSAAAVGEETWGDTGVKKAEYPICGTFLYSRGDEGVAYLGKGSDGAGYFYSRGDYRGSTIAGASGSEVNLWKRTVEESGKYTYTLVEPDLETAKPILHYSMDSSDIETVDGVKYMKNTLDSTGKHSAIVEGTAAGKGADGSEGGALSFNAWNYPASVDQMYLSDETVRYIDTKIHNQAYSYSFWAKMATDGNTDGNFTPFIGFYRKDGTYAGVFEQRWRGEVEYIVNGIGETTLGKPGKAGVSVGSKDDGWHFYTVTEKDGVGTVYCDGGKKGSYTVGRDHLYKNNIAEFIIGGGDAKIWYDKNNRGRMIGSVDELTIYSGALTESEVKTEYAKLTKDGSKVSAASVDVNAAVGDKLRASYDLTADKNTDLTVEVGAAVTNIAGLTSGTDFTAAGNAVTFKASWLASQSCGIQNLNMGDKTLELTITDKNNPLINYNFSESNVDGNVVKDTGVYGVDAVTTADTFDYNRKGIKNGALTFDGYDYKHPDYVKLSDENAAWLNSVLKEGYTMNFWANAAAENGSVMSMAGLYAADARPLGVVESYELSSNSADNSLDGKMVIHADAADSSLNKANAANSTAAVASDKVNVNEWHMYTVSYDKASGALKLYVDGVNKASRTVNDDIIGNIAQLFVGHQYKRYYNATGTRDYLTRGGFKGAIDSVSVYNNALGDEVVASLYSGDDVINGRIVFKDDFEDGLSASYVKESDCADPALAAESDNHSLRLNLVQDGGTMIRRKLTEELTDGVVTLNYRVKPAANASTMLWLMGGENSDMLRLPMFNANGKIAITDSYGLDAELGDWANDKSDVWYDVSAKLNLNVGIVDVSVKRDGAVIAQKNRIPTGISKAAYMRLQMYTGSGDSYFDDIVIASAADDYDGFIINDNFEDGTIDWSEPNSDTGRIEIGNDSENKVLNVVKNANVWSVETQKGFGKTYTDGTIHLSYRVKPSEAGVTTLASLSDGAQGQIRLPEFTSGGDIKITNDYNGSLVHMVRIIGKYTAGKWYEVNAAVDLDAGTYSISVNEVGADTPSGAIYEDYLNLKQIKRISLVVNTTAPAATSSFDNIAVRHEKTSSAEKVVFKDNFEMRENPTSIDHNWPEYSAGGGYKTAVEVVDGSHAAALGKPSSWYARMMKPFADRYTSGVITLSCSVKPKAGQNTGVYLGPDEWGWEDTNLMLTFSSDGNISIQLSKPSSIVVGNWSEGCWYDVYEKVNLNAGVVDISVKNRATGEEFKKSGMKTTLSAAEYFSMVVTGGNGEYSYFDDFVIKHKAGAELPYSHDFEDGTTGAMAGDSDAVVNNPDGEGKVFKLSDGGATMLTYHFGNFSNGKLQIEADVKTGSATCSTILGLKHPDSTDDTQMVLFGNNTASGHPGIWVNWEQYKYTDTRKENEWYHVKIIMDADAGTMDSWVTDSDGTTYSVKGFTNSHPKNFSAMYFSIWPGVGDESFIDNVKFTVPAENVFEVTDRRLSDNGVQINSLDALKSASNPAVNIGYNNTTDQDKSVWVVVNSYKGDRLIACMPQIVTIGADETEGTKSIGISDMSFAEADYVNVLIWDNVETMIPIFEPLPFGTRTNE